jgi:hypothetical protein
MKENFAGLALIAGIGLIGYATNTDGTQWLPAVLGGTSAALAVKLTISAAVDRVWEKAKDGTINKGARK